MSDPFNKCVSLFIYYSLCWGNKKQNKIAQQMKKKLLSSIFYDNQTFKCLIKKNVIKKKILFLGQIT